ncbi:MAG: tRNA cyclic N6-threonylcarbamoyladenosine(37) synthase TcdA [Cellvibrionaceae bacterium]
MSSSDHFTDSYQQRFGGIIRLYGTQAASTLLKSHILIIGIGGVGSWVAEALARSGIGTITLMDLDDICVTNTNRQVHTNCNTVGHPKSETMRERLNDINPEINSHIINDFIDKHNVTDYVKNDFSLVIDAIDNAIEKTELIAYCTKNNIPIISIGSSGGKKDPSQITYGDLKKTTGDILFAKIRNNLRRHHGFSRDTKKSFGVETIYSAEQMTYPDNQGETCQSREFLGEGEKLDCSGGYGAATMVTASFGFLAATRAIEHIIKKQKNK